MGTKKPLSEQVILVTGASSGLGRAIARGAGERGAKVLVTARNEKALQNSVAEIERSGSEALAVPADCTEQQQVERVVAQAVERFGRLDT
jgi:NADP-dependent 3-hydroxy acid dehydrogenase YdfG